MAQDIQRSMPTEITSNNPSCDTNIEGKVHHPNPLCCNQIVQQDEARAKHMVQAAGKQNQACQFDPPTSLNTESNSPDVKSMDEAFVPTVDRKKKTRNRMTYEERQSFIEKCVVRYQERRSTKLIAYELGVREPEVKQALFDFTQKHPKAITEAKIFLATPNTRIKDIGGKDNLSGFYEVVSQEDGSLICKPLSQSSTSSLE